MLRNDLAAALAGIGGSGGLLRSSEPLSLSPVAASQASALLEDAADLLVVQRDFVAVLDRCERGCESLLDEAENEEDHASSDTLKCSLCVVGIQALAEMNQWREVLPWILQYYQEPECWPPQILELCILLHSKVEEPHLMLEIGHDWLRSSGNQNEHSYGLLVQLYLFHVLLPLGHFAEAEDLVQGCKALSVEQNLLAHNSIQEKKCQWLQEEEEDLIPQEQPDVAWKQQLGSVPQRILSVLTQLRRTLECLAGQLCSIPCKKTLLAAFLLCLIVLRLDPASPTSLPFLYKLVQLFHQARLAVFSPHLKSSQQE